MSFFKEGQGYREVKANTVTSSLIIEEDLGEFISQTELNKKTLRCSIEKIQWRQASIIKGLD